MTVREKMVAKRTGWGLTRKNLADEIGISQDLLGMVENGDVTHPNIVEKIKEAYELEDEEAELLLPINRRPNGGKYDPDQYVAQHPQWTMTPKEESR